MSDVQSARIAALWRFPVKSMQGEQVSEVEFTEQGVVGDRAYALIDAQTGKVASGKSVKMYPTLLACRASFAQPPCPGREPPIVQISLPEGAQVTSDSPRVNSVLSNFFGRDVVLARSAPEDFTIDQYHPDVEDPDSAGVVVEQKLGSALFSEVGLPSPVAVGSFLDAFPVPVLTTAYAPPAEGVALRHCLRTAPSSDERHRRYGPSRLRRERLGRSRTPSELMQFGSGSRCPTREVRDDDLGPGRSAQGQRGPADPGAPQQDRPAWRSRAPSMRRGLRRGRVAGDGTGWRPGCARLSTAKAKTYLPA